MKISLCLLSILCSYSFLNAQEQEKRFYIGVNLGTSLLLNGNDSRGTVGANVNLINAGYSFKNKVGLHLKWMGAAHIISENNQVTYGGILLGPMYSLPIGTRTYLDLKLGTGLFWISEEAVYGTITNQGDPIIVDAKHAERSLSLSNLSAGLTLRHNFAKHWSLLLLSEYNSGKHSGIIFYVNGKRLQAMSINAGIAVRL